MRSIRWIVVIAVGLALAAGLAPRLLVASDHDDGETDTKGRSVNITDVYAFRECDQRATASCSNLILVMNVNPRSLARQQYYFSTAARYEIKVERPADINAEPTAAGLATPDVVLRFTFGAPDAVTRRQPITLTPVLNGVEGVPTEVGTTTALNDAPIISPVAGIAGAAVFAGLRQDPFFFDVEQFFRVRAGALGFGPPAVFRNPGIDFTWGYNVLSIVARIPVAFLAQGTGATAFDVWTTVSVPGACAGGFCQVERLAQPAINEGLLVTNDFLNALNAIGPEVEATLVEPANCAGALANPIIAEAAGTLLAFGNSVPQALAICNAFLPDVMRIEVLGPSGYARAVTTSGRPMRGRMILDDVIDITLSVVVPGMNPKLESDNVNYTQPAPISGTGHRPLLPDFPYLPAPN